MSTASEKNLTLGQQCVQFEHLNGLPTKYEKSSRKTIVSLQALLIASWVNQGNVQINVLVINLISSLLKMFDDLLTF